MEKKRVLVGMSGGVDSAAAAALLQDGGYEAAGCTLRLLDSEVLGQELESGCCSLEDVEDARSVARHLGIPYYVFLLHCTTAPRFRTISRNLPLHPPAAIDVRVAPGFLCPPFL